jgi:hypothetical protein
VISDLSAGVSLHPVYSINEFLKIETGSISPKNDIVRSRNNILLRIFMIFSKVQILINFVWMKVFQKIFCCLIVFLFLLSGVDSSMHQGNSVLFLTEHHESNERSGNESHIHSDNSENEFTIGRKAESFISGSACVTIRLTFLIPENREGAAVWQPPEMI